MARGTVCVLLIMVVAACSTTMTTSTKGAVCVAEKEIVLLENPNPLSTSAAADMMGRTVDSIKPGEFYEVVDTFQRTDPNTNRKTGPKYVKLTSKTRPQVTGWAFATPIRAQLVE